VKILADTHVAPALRRWSARLGLALVVAIAIGYLPGEALRRDPRAVILDAQLHSLEDEARALVAGNAALAREVEALRTDVSAIEDRARADLGMVYPDEVVLRVVADSPAAATAGTEAGPR
jgi:cell division protein FtsB